MQNNNNNNNKNNAIDLEKLKTQFKIELLAYKQSLANYMTNLQTDSSPYKIIGVGADGNLYSKNSVNESDKWQRVNDDSNGNVRSICCGKDGRTIYCTNNNSNIMSKSNWDAPNWISFDTGKGLFKAVTACPDGTLLGIGLENTLYQINSDGKYNSVHKTGESVICVSVGLNGSVFVCTSNGDVFKKNSYQNLKSQEWEKLNGGCCIKGMTVAPDGTFIGIGFNNYLYTKLSYTDLTAEWKGPYNSSCCVISITTVANKEPLISIKSKTFWGTGQVGNQRVYTDITSVDDCSALCSKTTGCSGATFNPTAHEQPMCWLRKGDADLGVGLDTDYAIVPETKKYLELMKSANSKLTDTNNKIMDIISSGKQDYSNLVSETSSSNTEMIQNYKVLQEDRKVIDKLLKKFDDLDEYQRESDLKTNQNYYSYILLSIIAIAICVILYIFTAPSKSKVATPSIQQGGKKISMFIFYLNMFFAMVLILIIMIFIKSHKKTLQ